MNIVSFGGGTNSAALLIGLYKHKIPIDLTTMQQGQEVGNNTFHQIRHIYLVAIELNLILVQLDVALHFGEVQNTGKVERIIHIQMNPE